MESWIIHNGYDYLGTAVSIEEARQICEEFCQDKNVAYTPKRELVDEDDLIVLIYQYRTLYLEVFVISRDMDIEAFAE
ncbi:MAG: hypothetical protein LBS36_01860 [Oscillospiraceae bacterium]|jgi:hypothetical protein|nr:hypothetical protein [Oscillospiraceae bacterium]